MEESLLKEAVNRGLTLLLPGEVKLTLKPIIKQLDNSILFKDVPNSPLLFSGKYKYT